MGFKNAPGITEFKRGMKCRYANEDYHIAYVTSTGNAIPAHRCVIIYEHIPEIELDLDSVWEGQERYDIPDVPRTKILALSNDMDVAFYAAGAGLGSMSVTAIRSALPYLFIPDPIDNNFWECPTCAEQTGTPAICSSCLHNRALIERLKRDSKS